MKEKGRPLQPLHALLRRSISQTCAPAAAAPPRSWWCGAKPIEHPPGGRKAQKDRAPHFLNGRGLFYLFEQNGEPAAVL